MNAKLAQLDRLDRRIRATRLGRVLITVVWTALALMLAGNSKNVPMVTTLVAYLPVYLEGRRLRADIAADLAAAPAPVRLARGPLSPLPARGATARGCYPVARRAA